MSERILSCVSMQKLQPSLVCPHTISLACSVHTNVSRWQINLQFVSIYKVHMCYFNGPTRAGQVCFIYCSWWQERLHWECQWGSS